MKKIAKLLGIILLAIVLLVGIFVGANWSDIKNFQPMPSGAFSKFMCSCMFVEGRSEEECKNWSRLSVPQQGYSIDLKKKSVTAKSLWYNTTSRYMGDRFGCTVE